MPRDTSGGSVKSMEKVITKKLFESDDWAKLKTNLHESSTDFASASHYSVEVVKTFFLLDQELPPFVYMYLGIGAENLSK